MSNLDVAAAIQQASHLPPLMQRDLLTASRRLQQRMVEASAGTGERESGPTSKTA